MQEDLELTAKVEMPQEFNAAIEFNENFSGGAKAAPEEAIKMVNRSKGKALEPSTKRLESPEKETLPDARNRYAALLKAIDQLTIGPLQPTGYSFAFLHAAIIRRLLAANERLASSAQPNAQPIHRIHPRRFEIIIDLNPEYPGGRDAAGRRVVVDHIESAKQEAKVDDARQQIRFEKDRPNSQYLFARLEARAIQALIDLDMEAAKSEVENCRLTKESTAANVQIDPAKFRAIFHIWPDFEVSACINKSIATVKADAAQNSFSAWGAAITWAVMDSGIRNDHPHFQKYANIDPAPGWHKDFTVDGAGPFDDQNSHGTHVAGIIAGEWRVPARRAEGNQATPGRFALLKKDTDDIEYQQTELDGICGMARRCKLVSLRVLDENGKGTVSNLIAAMDHVQTPRSCFSINNRRHPS
jgi:serine protease AprX